MTTKQKIIKTLYPVIQLFSSKKNIESPNRKQPLQSFYDLRAIANDGGVFDFSATLLNIKRYNLCITNIRISL
jgi:hypothetical protein